ncbi:ABC transporter transmembrane domain-containing protein [uncultured Shimia sp.]|uniref:ABC transporter transmembrane domain-containing protein n=1 Tax=uncultured Shimia sp. TaxID=573152 RepID=UPI0026074E15|nr:ABC transporter transmembrane domain-containing protein [uncultured Shimia sp.]
MLALTTCLFPLLYLTLELPKRIINDAISADQAYVYLEWLDVELDQITYLMVLCGGFLLAVIVHGLTKMRINTMKGILSERMLRRYRYTLIGRIMRFPQPYLRRTSQGEMVSMITSEAEPMGGMMGDAISLPVLQAGQMATILFFLFAQSFWFGVAACALIPFQAWIIPKLQRQINLHNKDRIKEVRELAGEIGETATGAATLRVNAGWRYRLAKITRRLGTLFDIRLTIYKKKFFMKFLNNFIGQLTPFFFYSVGGLLVIRGQVSLGALVAALAAYKDLSSPWKELLNYYNRMQDMSLRWHLILDRFAPQDMVQEELFDGTPDEIGHLDGDIELRQVTVSDHNGDSVLEDISLSIPNNALVGISAADTEERRALAELLTREVLPAAGKVIMGGRDLNDLHQMVIAARVGYAEVSPYVFEGTYGENLLMPLRHHPVMPHAIPEHRIAREAHRESETRRSGNSEDTYLADWVDPKLAGVASEDALRDWWVELMDALGSGNVMFRRGLDQVMSPEDHPDLARRIVELRPRIKEALEAADLGQGYYRFDPEKYNPALPVSANLFFATARQGDMPTQEASAGSFLELLEELGLAEGMMRLSVEVVEMLNLTFGVDGVGHPLFRRLGLNPELFEKLVELTVKVREQSLDVLESEDKVNLLTVPFEVSAEQIGPAFTDDLKDMILDMRHKQRTKIESWVSDHFEPLDESAYAPGLSVLENAIYGTQSSASGRSEAVHEVVESVLQTERLKQQVVELLFAVPTGLAGAGMPSAFAGPLSIGRAAMKRPDLLILDGYLGGDSNEDNRKIIRNLRALLPEAILIFLEDVNKQPEEFDIVYEIEHGRIKDSEDQGDGVQDNAASADLRQKMRALVSTDLFSGLDRKQLRLLAFGAQWFEAPANSYVFRQGDDGSDGAYLILEGEAEMILPIPGGGSTVIATSGPGTLVGELALIRKVPRALDMHVRLDLRALRLGEEEFLAVVENDAGTAFKIMQVLAGYVGFQAQRQTETDETE